MNGVAVEQAVNPGSERKKQNGKRGSEISSGMDVFQCKSNQLTEASEVEKGDQEV